jgi:hypothetical protein
MGILKKNKFIFWNLIALIFVKAIFSYSGSQFASLLNGVTIFGKEDVVVQTNILRTELGLSNLKENPTLDIAAAQKLQDMINGQYFAHTSPSGVSPWHWIEVNKYDYSYAGENLAIGFTTAQDTVSAWDNSPSHRENLLNPHYQETGVAVASAKIQGNEGFLVVQLFGTPRPVESPVVKTTPIPLASIKPTPTVKPAATENLNPTILPSVQISINEAQAYEPVAVTIGQPTLSTIAKASKILNDTFAFYSLITFLVSVLAIAFVEIRRELLVRTAISLVILVLAIALPVFHLIHTAFII